MLRKITEQSFSLNSNLAAQYEQFFKVFVSNDLGIKVCTIQNDVLFQEDR